MTSTSCPGCGSGAYVQGVCSTCGYQRRLDHAPTHARRRRPPCEEHAWGPLLSTQVAGEARQKCRRCRRMRQVEVPR